MVEKKKTTTKKVVEKPKVEKPEVELTPKEVKEVKVIERIIENKDITTVDVFGKLSRPQLNLIKRTIAKGASDDELKLFIQVCKGANLNPFLKQVFLVPRWDSKEGREVRSIQVSIDGFRSIAESSGAYAGNEDPIFTGETEITVKGRKITVPDKATVKVYKMVQGLQCVFTSTARWPEYYPGERLGFQWHIRPYLMLGKCAEALALRKAFPKLLSGMYAQEEMDKSSEIESQEKKVQKGFITLMKMMETASEKVILDYKAKMESSDKYTTAQKNQFNKLIEKRLEELKSIE